MSPPVLRSWAALAAAAAALTACGGTTGARPDDMSAEAHRQAAESHNAEAGTHDQRYDPNASQVRGGAAGRGDFEYSDDVYNPTEVHHEAAEMHREQAADHMAAAQALAEFEQAECGSFPPATRSVCPLLGDVASTEPIDEGIRVHFAESVPIAAALAHVRCHLAYARSQGRGGMDRCPLYLPGVAAEQSGSDAVDLTTEDDATRATLRQRTMSHVAL